MPRKMVDTPRSKISVGKGGTAKVPKVPAARPGKQFKTGLAEPLNTSKYKGGDALDKIHDALHDANVKAND